MWEEKKIKGRALMNTLQNLHTHTTYCDGKDTVEEMINAALEKGFGGIGFSGHSYMFYSPSHSMSLEGTEKYREEVKDMKEKYRGKIDVFLGLEFDAYSKDVDLSGYDYVIGSYHYLKFGDEYVGFDRSADEVARVINTYFGGDGMAFVKESYRQMARLPEYGKIDIIGHFDIITKNIEKVNFFDTDSDEYLKYAFLALDAMRGKIPFFEVNTGAISRGYRTTPYPMKNILRQMKEWGFGAVISSDCHDSNYLDCAFDGAREILLECGFKEKYILTPSGFCAVEL